MMAKVCMGDPLIKRLCEALGLKVDEVSCITIVCACEDVVRVKVERYADQSLEKYDFESLVDGAPIS